MEKSRIPAADGQRFRHWPLPEVGAAAPEPAPRGPTAGELEAIAGAAQAEGHARGLEEGRAEGLAQGLAEGRAAARAELDQELAALRALMAALQEPIAGQDRAIEQALAQLAVEIAGLALGREPALPAAALVPAVRAALRELPAGARDITVHLHPDQLEQVRGAPDWPVDWSLAADPALAPGGCRVAAGGALVDHSLGLRLRQVAARLLAPADPDAAEPGLLLAADDD